MPILLHTLSVPEHIWLNFFRKFFSQDVLYVDDDGTLVQNEFMYDESADPDRRLFDIVLEFENNSNAYNILPQLVIEDNGASSAHLVTDNRTDWSTIPSPHKERTDIVRATYTFHCLSATRGSSRILASIIINAITYFYDVLTRNALHKIEPWQVGKTVSVASEEEIVYDTPIMISFSYEQKWLTEHSGNTNIKSFSMDAGTRPLSLHVLTTMTVQEPSSNMFILTSMSVEEQKTEVYLLTILDARDQMSENNYVRTALDVNEPASQTLYLRTTMRVG